MQQHFQFSIVTQSTDIIGRVNYAQKSLILKRWKKQVKIVKQQLYCRRCKTVVISQHEFAERGAGFFFLN